MWQLQYVVGSVVKETIATNLSFPMAKWKRKELLDSGNYKLGLIKLSKMK